MGHSYALLLLNGKWFFSPDYSGNYRARFVIKYIWNISKYVKG